MKKTCLAGACILAIALFSVSGNAATVTSTLNVSVNVGVTCTVSTTAIDFGSYAGLDIQANGDVTVACPAGAPYSIALDAGLNANTYGPLGSGFSRGVANGPDVLYYRLAKDNAYTEEWGDANLGDTYTQGSLLSDTGTGAAQPHTVYGFLYGDGINPTYASAGLYTDVVQVTVHY